MQIAHTIDSQFHHNLTILLAGEHNALEMLFVIYQPAIFNTGEEPEDSKALMMLVTLTILGRCVICYVSMGAPTPTFPLCPRQVQILVNVKPEDFKHYWSFYHCVKRSYENTPVQLTIIKCHINAILQNHTIRDNTTQYQTTMPSFHF